MKKIAKQSRVLTKAVADEIFMSVLKDCLFYNSRLKRLVKKLSGDNFEAFYWQRFYNEDFPLRQLYQETHSEELRTLCSAHKQAQVKLIRVMYAVSDREAVLNYFCNGYFDYHHRELYICADAVIEALRLGFENNDKSWLRAFTLFVSFLPQKAAVELVRLGSICRNPDLIDLTLGNISLLPAPAQIEMIKQCFYRKSLDFLQYYVKERDNEPCLCHRAQLELIRLSFEEKYYDAFKIYVSTGVDFEHSKFGNITESCLGYKAQVTLVKLSIKHKSFELLEIYLQKFALSTIALEKLIDLSLKAEDAAPVLLYIQYHLLCPDLLFKIAKRGDLPCARAILKEHYVIRQFEDLDSSAYLAKTFGISCAYDVMDKG